MPANFNVQIISPDKTILNADTEEVIIPSYEGYMTILKDHISLITFLRPGYILIKQLTGSNVDWFGYHKSISPAAGFKINQTANPGNDSGYWNNTAPTNSVFSVGNANTVNGSGVQYIAYCWAEVKGYSKFGAYYGNGNDDGTFVYTGFKPAFIMIKNATVISNWRMFDNKRIGYNVANYKLLPNSASQETTDVQIDMLSNGFKIRTSDSEINSGVTHIYMAFAENPLVSSKGIPTTAR